MEEDQKFVVNNLENNQKLKKMKFQEDKNNMKLQIEQVIKDIQSHVTEFHQEQCDCTNILNFLVANLECLIEDLSNWTSNDRESWQLVISPEGVCAMGQQYPQKIQQYLQDTKLWEEEYKELVDPLLNSMKKIDDSQQDNGIYEDEEDLKQKLEEIKEQRKLLEEKLKEQKQQQQGEEEQQQQIQQQQEQDKQQKELEEQFQKEKKQKQIQVKKLVQSLEAQVQKNKKQCDCYTLQNQLRQLQEDLEYWCQIDQTSWFATLKILKVESELGKKVKQEAIDLVVEMKVWKEKYKGIMEQDKEISNKFGENNNQLQQNNVFDKIGQIDNFDLVSIDKMQQDLQDAMNQLNIWQNQIIQEDEYDEDKL